MQSIKQQKIHITTNIKNLKNKIYDENSEINVYKRHIKNDDARIANVNTSE